MTVKDFSLLIKEPLKLKFSDDVMFQIPVDPSLEFTYKLMDFEDKMNAAETNKDRFDLLIDMVVMILKQDESQKITKDFVKKNLHMSQIQGVVKVYQQQVQENQNNPN